MAKSGYAQRIRARVQELRSIINEAQAELVELEVAERVLERLSADQASEQDVVAREVGSAKKPTIADMVVSFLSEVGPMATPQLLEHMREHWREDLGETTLASTLSRTKAAGRIDQQDGLWLVPVDNGPNRNSGSAVPEEAKPEDANDIFGLQNPNQDRLGQ